MVKGKILFKENIILNYNRPDRIYCSFDELSTDILENRIIKFVLQSLSQCYYFDDNINAKMLQLSKFLDEITLQPITNDAINLIDYTPLNHHYKTILLLCELFLQSFSIEQRIGEKTVNAFLIDMNLLFEKFIVNLIKERFQNEIGFDIEEQKSEYADSNRDLEVRLDILVNYNKTPIFVLDTKYMEFEGKPNSSHIAQMNLYSNIKKIKNCGLVYHGNSSNIIYYLENIDLYLNILSVDLIAFNQYEFNEKCNAFINTLKTLLFSLR